MYDTIMCFCLSLSNTCFSGFSLKYHMTRAHQKYPPQPQPHPAKTSRRKDLSWEIQTALAVDAEAATDSCAAAISVSPEDAKLAEALTENNDQGSASRIVQLLMASAAAVSEAHRSKAPPKKASKSSRKTSRPRQIVHNKSPAGFPGRLEPQMCDGCAKKFFLPEALEAHKTSCAGKKSKQTTAMEDDSGQLEVVPIERNNRQEPHLEGNSLLMAAAAGSGSEVATTGAGTNLSIPNGLRANQIRLEVSGTPNGPFQNGTQSSLFPRTPGEKTVLIFFKIGVKVSLCSYRFGAGHRWLVVVVVGSGRRSVGAAESDLQSAGSADAASGELRALGAGARRQDGDHPIGHDRWPEPITERQWECCR